MGAALTRNWRIALAFGCLVYPWLHVGARGPNAVVEPWLVALACTAGFLALSATRGADRGVPGLLPVATGLGLALWLCNAAAVGALVPTNQLVGAWAALALVAACAHAAAAMPGWRGKGQPVDAASMLAWAWLAAGSASSVIALLQIAGWADLLGPLAAPSPLRHAFGNLRQKNQYATLANLALLSLGWLSARGRGPRPAVCAVAALLLCAGIAASASRMGALQLLAVCALLVVWHRRERRSLAWLGVAAVAYGGAAVWLLLALPAGNAAPGILRRMLEGDPGCLSRLLLWDNLWQLAKLRAWAGWGWGELGYAMYAVPAPVRFCAYVANAHNLPLQLAVDAGLPLAILFCLGVLYWIARAKPWRGCAPDHQFAWGAIALLGFHSLLEHPLWFGPFQMVLGLCLGLLLGRLGKPHARVWPWAAATALAVGTAFAALDWLRVAQLYLPPEQRLARYTEDTLAKASSSWLFAEYVDYAELQLMEMTRKNAEEIAARADRLMHFFPVPGVVEKRILALRLMGRTAEAADEALRYSAAFPAEHAAFAAAHPAP